MTKEKDVCDQVLNKLTHSDGLADVVQAIGTGIESGMTVWHLLIDNPMILGMFLGGAMSTYLRRWLAHEFRKK
jgi:hypothetical protein